MRPEILYPYFTTLENVSGIGKKTATLCEKLCGKVVFDLLTHLPTGFIDRRLKTKIADAPENTVVTIEAAAIEHKQPANRKSPYRVICQDETGEITIVFFHVFGDYPLQALPLNEKRLISGKVERFGIQNSQIQMTHPDYIVSVTNFDKIPKIECVYPLTAGLSGKILNKAIRTEIEKIPDLPEWQDPEMIKREGWPSFNQALRFVHIPENESDLSKISLSKTRLAYDELLANQLALALVRKNMRRLAGRSIVGNSTIRKQILNGLGFSLTRAQIRVLKGN